MISGIYVIRHRESGKQYVGSSRDIERRWELHRGSLRRGDHHSILLQRAFNKYGFAAFEFAIVEIVHADDDLLTREQAWIDTASEYNICRVAGRRDGTKWSDESKARKSEQHKKIGISPQCRAAQSQSITVEQRREWQKKATESRYRNGNARPSVRWKNTPENRAAHIAKLAVLNRKRGSANDSHKI